MYLAMTVGANNHTLFNFTKQSLFPVSPTSYDTQAKILGFAIFMMKVKASRMFLTTYDTRKRRLVFIQPRT